MDSKLRKQLTLKVDSIFEELKIINSDYEGWVEVIDALKHLNLINENKHKKLQKIYEISSTNLNKDIDTTFILLVNLIHKIVFKK